MDKIQSYIKGIMFDMIIDSFIEEELSNIIEGSSAGEISQEVHENILSKAYELIIKIERIGFVKFYLHLIKEFDNFKDDDMRGQEMYWQDFN